MTVLTTCSFPSLPATTDAAIWLVTHGASTNLQKQDGWQDTVLHYAASKGHIDMVDTLLAFGSDPAAKNCAGGVLHMLLVATCWLLHQVLCDVSTVLSVVLHHLMRWPAGCHHISISIIKHNVPAQVRAGWLVGWLANWL